MKEKLHISENIKFESKQSQLNENKQKVSKNNAFAIA